MIIICLKGGKRIRLNLEKVTRGCSTAKTSPMCVWVCILDVPRNEISPGQSEGVNV